MSPTPVTFLIVTTALVCSCSQVPGCGSCTASGRCVSADCSCPDERIMFCNRPIARDR